MPLPPEVTNTLGLIWAGIRSPQFREARYDRGEATHVSAKDVAKLIANLPLLKDP